MNILATIKADRELTFDYWRYRLLHFSFGINPKTPEESFLPKFLYTHYCPLFHITNLLVLIFPFLLVGKILDYAIIFLTYYLFVGIINTIYYIKTRIPWYKGKPLNQISTMTDEERKQFELSYIPKAIRLRRLHTYEYMVEYFENIANKWFTREEFETEWRKQKELYEQELAIKTKIKKDLKDELVFLINLSRILIKSLFVLFMSTIVLFCVVGLTFFIYTIITQLTLAGFLDFINFLMCFVLFISMVSIPIITLLMFLKSKFMEYVANLLNDVFVNVCRFIYMFFDNNCPAIILKVK